MTLYYLHKRVENTRYTNPTLLCKYTHRQPPQNSPPLPPPRRPLRPLHPRLPHSLTKPTPCLPTNAPNPVPVHRLPILLPIIHRHLIPFPHLPVRHYDNPRPIPNSPSLKIRIRPARVVDEPRPPPHAQRVYENYFDTAVVGDGEHVQGVDLAPADELAHVLAQHGAAAEGSQRVDAQTHGGADPAQRHVRALPGGGGDGGPGSGGAGAELGSGFGDALAGGASGPFFGYGVLRGRGGLGDLAGWGAGRRCACTFLLGDALVSPFLPAVQHRFEQILWKL